MQMKIQAITLDCWDTILIQTDHSIEEKRWRLVRRFFLLKGFSDEKILKAIEEEREKYLKGFREQQLTPSLEPRLNTLVEILYGKKNPEIVFRLAEDIIALLAKTTPVLVPGVQETLNVLAARYRLGLISNVSITPGYLVKKWLEDLKVDHFFHTLIFSNDHNMVAKPHPAIFMATLERMGEVPSRAAHVGDNEELDVQGAHAAGMKAILFSGVIPAPPQSGAESQVDDFRMIPEAIQKLQN